LIHILKSLSFVSLFLALFTSGCATTGGYLGDFNLVSVEEEKAIGLELQKEISSQKKITNDWKPNQKVNSIGKRLVSNLPRRDYDYEFFVIEDETPNAFAIPGGAIYVHTGLLDFVDDDHQVAGVLAHEIAHLSERHTAKNLTRIYGAQVLASMLIKDDTGVIKNMAVQMAAGGVLASFSRRDEEEADKVGYYLAKKSGFKENGIIKFLIKLEKEAPRGTSLLFLNRHPSTPDRIARLEALRDS